MEARWKHGTRPVSFFFFHVVKRFAVKQWCISRLSTTFVRLDESFLPGSSFRKSIDSDERYLTFDCFASLVSIEVFRFRIYEQFVISLII